MEDVTIGTIVGGVYYSHCIALYNTPQEGRDLIALSIFKRIIINPNCPTIEHQCKALRESLTAGFPGDPTSVVMGQIFKPLVEACGIFAFRALPDGRIPAGVAQELTWAREFLKPIFELPSNVRQRIMSIPSTREYLHEVGQR